VRSKPEDRKVSGLWHFWLGAVERRAIQSGSRNWVAAWRSSSWLLGSSRWDAAPSRSDAGARSASEKGGARKTKACRRRSKTWQQPTAERITQFGCCPFSWQHNRARRCRVLAGTRQRFPLRPPQRAPGPRAGEEATGSSRCRGCVRPGRRLGSRRPRAGAARVGCRGRSSWR
jgi:hypothetical protein